MSTHSTMTQKWGTNGEYTSFVDAFYCKKNLMCCLLKTNFLLCANTVIVLKCVQLVDGKILCTKAHI